MERKPKTELRIAEKPDDKPTPTPRTVTKKVRKVEEYTTDEPINSAPPQPVAARTIDITARPVSSEEEEEDDDPMEIWLAQLEEESSTVIMRVDRLPMWSQTRTYGRGTYREFCGEMSFSGATYLTDIQNLYGAGHYLLTLMDANHRFLPGGKNRFPIHIAEPRQAPGTAPPAGVGVLPIPGALPVMTSVVDPLDQLEALLKRANSLREALGINQSSQASQAVMQQAPEKSIEEKQVDFVLNLLSSNSPESKTLGERLLDKMFPEQLKEPTIIDQVIGLIQPVVPIVAPILAPVLQAMAYRYLNGNAASVPTMNTQSGNGSTTVSEPVPTPQILRAPPQPQQQPVEGLSYAEAGEGGLTEEAHMEVIDTLLADCERCIVLREVDQEVVQHSAQAVRALQRNPIWSRWIKGLLASPPEAVLSGLVMLYPDSTDVASNPLSTEFIKALQVELNKEAK